MNLRSCQATKEQCIQQGKRNQTDKRFATLDKLIARKSKILLLLLIPTLIYAADKVESAYKTFRLNTTDIAITCKNGNIPITRSFNDDKSLVIVSCSNK
jgi:hypothetical protein